MTVTRQRATHMPMSKEVQQAHTWRRWWRDERGESGPLVVVFFVIGISIVWFVGSWIMGYIYDTKEDRAAQSKHQGKGQVTSTTMVHELGDYTVHYNQ